MRTPIVLLAAMVLLAACSAEQIAAYKTDPVNAMAPEYGPGCEKAGYAKGSEQWRTCILQASRENDIAQWEHFWIRQPQWYSWDRTH